MRRAGLGRAASQKAYAALSVLVADGKGRGALDRGEPPEAYRGIIRGVRYTYRSPGRKRWSKVLVRHGADARLALAAVLEVSAEDIQVRDCGGSGDVAFRGSEG